VQPNLVLAVTDDGRRSAYEELLRKEDVAWQTVASLRELADLAAAKPHHAFLLDMQLIVRSSLQEKALVDDALRALPHARLNVAPHSRKIVILAEGEARGIVHTLEEYLGYCRTQPLRIVHPRTRIPLHLHALLSSDPGLSPSERTVCLDVSHHGCFLFSANNDRPVGSSVWIRLVTLTDATPIRATVRWKREWGTSHEFPGIGVHFEEVSSDQEKEIHSLLERKRHELPPGGPGTDSRHLPHP
jgi:hypothetical protein